MGKSKKREPRMVTVEIYFSDLNPEAQARLMESAGISNPSEANWDIDICPLVVYEMEVGNG